MPLRRRRRLRSATDLRRPCSGGGSRQPRDVALADRLRATKPRCALLSRWLPAMATTPASAADEAPLGGRGLRGKRLSTSGIKRLRMKLRSKRRSALADPRSSANRNGRRRRGCRAAARRAAGARGGHGPTRARKACRLGGGRLRNCHSRVSAWSSAWWASNSTSPAPSKARPRLIAAAPGVGFQIADSGYRQLTLLEGRAELRGQGSAVPRPFGAAPMQAMVQVNGADVRQASHGVQQHRRIETAAGGPPTAGAAARPLRKARLLAKASK